MPHKKCPCCSGKSYEECCKPFHEGTLPETAVQLMRSRYSAYAKNLPDYILLTTHPDDTSLQLDNEVMKNEIRQFSEETVFQHLEILDFCESGNQATVTFNATLSQRGRDVSFTEKSSFKRVNSRWLYLEGEIFPANK